jgi:hypothetical protein
MLRPNSRCCLASTRSVKTVGNSETIYYPSRERSIFGVPHNGPRQNNYYFTLAKACIIHLRTIFADLYYNSSLDNTGILDGFRSGFGQWEKQATQIGPVGYHNSISSYLDYICEKRIEYGLFDLSWQVIEMNRKPPSL